MKIQLVCGLITFFCHVDSAPVLNSQKSDSSVSDNSIQMEVDCEKTSVSQVDVDSGFENMEVDESDGKRDFSRRQRVRYLSSLLYHFVFQQFSSIPYVVSGYCNFVFLFYIDCKLLWRS